MAINGSDISKGASTGYCIFQTSNKIIPCWYMMRHNVRAPLNNAMKLCIHGPLGPPPH